MATHAAIDIVFSDGSVTFLRDEISENTLTEIQTDASGILNITGDISVGVANQGKTATHAICKIQTDSATSGAFAYAAFYGPQGNVLCPIQGGGSFVSGNPPLKKPVRMQSGVVVKVFWQAVADAVQYGSTAVYCASGKCDIFQGLAVDDTNVSMVNKDNATWGEALAGETVVATMSTYSASNGLADTGVADGIDGFFVESASGQLMGLFYPAKGSADQWPVPWAPCRIRVSQNDTLTLRANV